MFQGTRGRPSEIRLSSICRTPATAPILIAERDCSFSTASYELVMRIMRFALPVVLTLALPAMLAAQSKGHARQPFTALGPIGLPLAPLSPTLPSFGAPLPTFDLPKIDSSFRIRGLPSGRSSQHPRGHNRQGGYGYGFQYPLTSFVYVMPPYYMDGYASPPIDEPAVLTSMPVAAQSASPIPRSAPRPPMGWLRLELDNAAAGAQLYVNGYFVGTTEDVNDELGLEPGPHQIEIRSAGSPSIHFDVQIVDGRTITYRAAFERLPGSVAAPGAPYSAPTIYFIPGCYLGNVTPQQANLPAGCDIARLSTYKP